MPEQRESGDHRGRDTCGQSSGGVSADVWTVRGALTQRLRPAAPGDRTEGGSVPTVARGLLCVVGPWGQKGDTRSRLGQCVSPSAKFSTSRGPPTPTQTGAGRWGQRWPGAQRSREPAQWTGTRCSVPGGPGTRGGVGGLTGARTASGASAG